MLYLGLMSGTSMDGIDAAVIETDGRSRVNTLAGLTERYDDSFHHLLKYAEKIAHNLQGDPVKINREFLPRLKQQLSSAAFISMEDYFLKKFNRPLSYKHLAQASALLHLNTARRLLFHARLSQHHLHAVGYHGQTLFHDPAKRTTLQMANAHTISAGLNTTVVYDFRSQDVALGGQGAPLAPIYHRALALRDSLYPVAVINIGGIANVSFIDSDSLEGVCGFDTGPGNTLCDHYLKKQTHGKILFYKDGHYSEKGRLHEDLMAALYKDERLQAYLNKTGPKSLDVNDFQLPSEFFNASISQADACYTLLNFTAELIKKNLVSHPVIPRGVIVCGGGSNNPTLIKLLKEKIERPVYTAQEKGWHSDTLEAELMAYLAARRLQNLPTSLPAMTGVARALSCGKVLTAL